MGERIIRNCSICNAPRANAYRVAGLLLRYVCDDCFQTRCIHCGTDCVDTAGRFLPGVTFGIYYALYCASCSTINMENLLGKDGIASE